MTFSVSYRIAALKWIYRIVSYRHRLSCCIASEHGYRLLSYRALSFCTGLYSTERLQPGGRKGGGRGEEGGGRREEVNSSSYRKLSPPSPNRIVSYRIVSPWRGYRLLAYRELSQIALIGKYRIVTYRALIVSYRIVRSRAM